MNNKINNFSLKGYKNIKDHSRYFINREGSIWDNLYNREVPHSRSNNNSIIVHVVNDKLQKRMTMYVSRLIISTFVPIPTHLEDIPLKEILIKHLDGNTDNINLKNLCYYHPRDMMLKEVTTPYKSKCLKLVGVKGCRVIPGNELYAVNRDGSLLIRIDTGRRIAIQQHTEGYKKVIMSDDTKAKRVKNMTMHRLVAFTWVERPEKYKDVSFDSLVVNHIDGNKQNNDADNLEWCTHADNTHHASDNGMKRQGWVRRAMEIRNVDTGEVSVFPSTNLCAIHLGIDAGMVYHKVKKGQCKIWPDRYQYKYVDDGEWDALPDAKTIDESKYDTFALVVWDLDMEEKTTQIMDIKQLIELTGVNRSTLHNYLERKNKTPLANRYVVRYLRRGGREEIADMNRPTRYKLLVTDTTGVREYDNLKQCLFMEAIAINNKLRKIKSLGQLVVDHRTISYVEF